MVNWLYRLPDFAVFAVLIIPFVLAILIATYLGHRILLRFKSDTSSFEIMDAFIAVSSAAAVILAFSLVQVDTSLRALEDNITREASAINSLDRILVRFGDQQSLALRAPLMEYARTIVKEEWRELSDGERNDKVDDLQRIVAGGVRGIDPVTPLQITLYNEAVRSLDQLQDLREGRLNAAAGGLSSLFWRAILAIFGILVLIAWHTEPTRKRVWSMGAIAATLGLLLALVVILDAPFAGENTVQPDAIDRIITIMSIRR